MFKKFHYLLLGLFLSTSLMAQPTPQQQQQDAERSLAISFSPIALIGGSLNTLFQWKLASVMSLTVPLIFSYSYATPIVLDYLAKTTQNKFKSTMAPILFTGGLGARLYPTGKGMTDGFYLEPRFLITYDQFGGEASGLGKVEWTRVNVSPRLNLGWDWFYDSGFYMNFGGGLGYSWDVKPDVKIDDKVKDAMGTLAWLPFIPVPKADAKSKFEWELEFKLGFAW